MNNNLPVIKVFNESEFNDKVAKELGNILKEQLKYGKNLNVALSGGNSPLPAYKSLSLISLEWKRINFFLVDERCVGVNNPENNYLNIYRNLFKYIPSKSYPIIKNGISYSDSAKHYQELIKGNIYFSDKTPQFDLIVLGLGLDGHTASLFSNTSALKIFEELVVLNRVPELKSERITMTYPLIMNSKKIVLIAKGKSKREVLDMALKFDFPISKLINHIDIVFN